MLTAASLLVAACGGADDPQSSPASAAPSQETASAAPAQETGVASTDTEPSDLPAAATEPGEAASDPPSPSAPPASEQAASEQAEAAESIVVTPGPVALLPALGGRVFDQPIELGPYPGDRVFVAELEGVVFVFDLDGGGESLLLDLRERVSRRGGEEGLLSVALDPAFEANGYLYAYYSVGGDQRTRLSRFTVRADVADPASELVLLEVEQPFRNHNGGAVRFGPDGHLYLGLGDGGAGGDPLGSGQDLGTLLGSVIRIDVRPSSIDERYDVPEDNPFLDVPGARQEIWAYGLRNPWRMAFDPQTGKLWLGDVGQDRVEEINVIERGGNYGWNRLEGTACFAAASGCDASGTIAPVAVYRHDEGCSVTGGVVYRGAGVPSIAGAYLYADFCSGRVWALSADAPGAQPVVIAESGVNVGSFGVDGSGEVYLLSFGGPVLRVAALP